MESNGLMSPHVGFNEAPSLVILTLGVVKLICEEKKWQNKLQKKNERRRVRDDVKIGD